MVIFSSLKCIMVKYHPPKCLLDAQANNYPYSECFASLLTSELEIWTDQQRVETPDTLGRPVLKQGVFLWGNISVFTDSHGRLFWWKLCSKPYSELSSGWGMFTCVSTTVAQGSVLVSTLLIIFHRQLIVP